MRFVVGMRNSLKRLTIIVIGNSCFSALALKAYERINNANII